MLNSKDVHNRPAEDFLHFPPDAQPPKFLRDIYKINATHLCFNNVEDILWWTGELIYRFQFPLPIKSLKLESPDGNPTTVGDWEWQKANRAVRIYASQDEKEWKLIWQSSGQGGVTPVHAEIPSELSGSKTIYLKFWGQNANVLFDLYITATLDAKPILPLLHLKKGKNDFTFSDAQDSSHNALLFWEGKGIRLEGGKKEKIIYPKDKPLVRESASEISILFPQGVEIWLERREGVLLGLKRITVGQREILNDPNPQAPSALFLTNHPIKGITDWVDYLRERQELGGNWRKLPGVKIEERKLEGEVSKLAEGREKVSLWNAPSMKAGWIGDLS